MTDTCPCGRSRECCTYHDPLLQPKPPTPPIDPAVHLAVGGLSFEASYECQVGDQTFDLTFTVPRASPVALMVMAMCYADRLGTGSTFTLRDCAGAGQQYQSLVVDAPDTS